jgi:7-cyano-7-deazaguanine synthase
MAKMVAVLSGGLDSTTLFYKAKQEHELTSAVSFNYGQRHKKELEFAKQTVGKWDMPHHIIDLSQSGLVEAFAPSGSSLVTDTSVPEGHYGEDSMKATVVPNRNMIMLSVAAGVMVNNSYKMVGTGVHAGDHFVYPDCRPEFLQMVNAAIFFGNEGFGLIPKRETLSEHAVPGFLYAPFLNKSKADIAYQALQLQVPFENTWSCYKGGEKHCGKCGTCVERLEAIDEAVERFADQPTIDRGAWTSQYDKTQYEDTEFWKTAIKENSK